MAYQYPSFNALKDAFDGSVEVIGIPCSQFFNQEPGSPAEIMNALQYVRPGDGFQPNFTLFQKSEINGANRMDLYKWILGLCDVAPKPEFLPDKGIYMYNQFTASDIRWNYEKILFDKNGKPYRRYDSGTETDVIIPDIEMLLAQ
jgi:glutathione peroxidase